MIDAQILEQLKQRLLAEKQRLEDQIEREDQEIKEMTAGHGNESTYSNHMADDGGYLMDLDRTTKMRENLMTNLKQVRSALDRMEKGTYGYSEVSGKEIPADRLEALPWATKLVNE